MNHYTPEIQPYADDNQLKISLQPSQDKLEEATETRKLELFLIVSDYQYSKISNI